MFALTRMSDRSISLMHECLNALMSEWLTHQLLKQSCIQTFGSSLRSLARQPLAVSFFSSYTIKKETLDLGLLF